MKVCLETSTFRARFAGIAYYAWFLAFNLLRQEAVSELSGFDGSSFAPLTEEGLEAILRADRGERTSSRLYHRARQVPLMRASYRAYKGLRFRRGVGGFDLFHAINYVAPAEVAVPVLPLIHDVSHERFPQAHPAERVAWLRRGLRHLDRYPLLNTISRFSADEIADFYGYPIERIRVSHPGVNPIFRQPPAEAALAGVAAQGLEAGQFFLTVGTIEPRKNHDVLIDAYARLPRDFRRAHPLVFVGQPGWGRLTSRHADALRQEGSVRFTGYADEPTLAAYYASAAALLFPTIYEGFGIPVAEAMAAGLPAIVSDIPIMHEVAGESASYVSAREPEAWAAAIGTAAARSGEARATIAAAGRRQSAAFTWEHTAERTAAIYREILAAG
ncbi:MAG: glycosyltransferase family 4 protein [Pararhizobium sp.]